MVNQPLDQSIQNVKTTLKIIVASVVYVFPPPYYIQQMMTNNLSVDNFQWLRYTEFSLIAVW